MNLNFLKNKKSNYRQCGPWEHFIVDDFMPRPCFQNLQKTLCSVTEGFSKRENDPFDLNFMLVPDLSIAELFLSDEFQDFIERITEAKLEIYEGSLVQLRKMTPESPAFEPHVDNQDERSLVCIWYLSPNWSEGKGGELNLLAEKTAEPTKVISPIENRMVMFFSDDSHWHSVNKVHDWNRYSIITEWIVK